MISDLLKPDRTNLHIREDKKRGVYVDKLSEWVVRTPEEVYELMERGSSQRATGATKLNEASAHAACELVSVPAVTTAWSQTRGARVCMQSESLCRGGVALATSPLRRCVVAARQRNFAGRWLALPSLPVLELRPVPISIT